MGPVLLVQGVPGRDDGRDRLREPRLPPGTVKATERQFIAADLVHQVGQQRGRQPVGGEVLAVFADDSRQGAQVLFAGRHRSCHQVPLPNGTPVGAVWVSAERQMAAMAAGCTHWYPTSRNLSSFCSTAEKVITVQKKNDSDKAGGTAARRGA